MAFELVHEAFAKTAGDGGVALGLFLGSCVFLAGDSVIDHFGGGDRKHSGGKQAAGSALAIVLGSSSTAFLNPSSSVLRSSRPARSVPPSLVAVFLSNLPEAIVATSGLSKAGWEKGRVLGLWTIVALVCGLAALAGFGLLDTATPQTIAIVLSFAGGAILTMLADTMMPEAFEHGGKLVGIFTTAGFALA